MRSSERLVVVGGLGMAVASVIPWYTADELAFESTRTNGWQEPDAVLSQLGTVAGVLLAVVVLVGSRQPERPRFGSVSWGAILTVGGVVALGLVALKFSLNLERTTVGIYLSLTAGVTQLYGGYVTYLESSGELSSGRSRSPVTGTATTAYGSTSPTAQWPTQGQATTPTSQVQAPAQPDAASTSAAWPETAYLLSAWATRSPTIEAAATAYRQAFAGDPARLQRVAAEVQALLAPAREADRYALVATHVPSWAPWPTQQIFTHLDRALTGETNP